MNISNEIKTLLIAFLEEKVIVASWGISHINITNTMLKFNVNGFKFKGQVIIEAKSTGVYIIKIGEKTFKEICLDEIVKIVDNEVEHTEDYLLDLRDYFGI